MKKITVNVRSFENIMAKGEYIYVDKTEYVYKLVCNELQNYYFISRPRRFGKSLMCSVLQNLFEGKRELFKGLYIDSTDYSFEKYPVLHFNFADYNWSSYDSFLTDFQTEICREAVKNGIAVENGEPSSMLKSVLNEMDGKAVIIVDEYDTPIIHTYTNIELADRIRETLSAFYTVIKNNDDKVRFFFITGITKFSNMSIFSQMNNLNDLTFDKDYATAFGYTENEIETYFSEYIDQYMRCSDREYETREDFLSAVRKYYDGYRFSYRNEVKVYNPVSVGKFFNSGCEFEPYWVNTGASTLAVSLAKDYQLSSVVTQNPVLLVNEISTFDYRNLATHSLGAPQILALIYFTGYLTIKDGDSTAVTLMFPNREVQTAFSESLIGCYNGGSELSKCIAQARTAIRSNDIPALVNALNAYYEKLPHVILSKEIGYQAMFYVLFLIIGVDSISVEEATTLGRIDVVIVSRSEVYVIELKVNQSVKKALEQIRKKRYYAKYINSDKRIHIVGLNFTSRSRKISSFREEIIDKTKEPTFLG